MAFKKRNVFRDPVYLEYKADGVTVGIETSKKRFAWSGLPERGEVVKIEVFGGELHILVDVIRWGQDPTVKDVLTINGREVKLP